LGLCLVAAFCRVARLATAISIGKSAFPTKLLIEPLGKLTERGGSAAKVTVLFFQIVNGVEAFSQPRVVLAHTAPSRHSTESKRRTASITYGSGGVRPALRDTSNPIADHAILQRHTIS
jgi:hypothetical protein